MAEYLLAEVLDRQSERVRLLLRTSILERVNGELAGLLTGDEGGERGSAGPGGGRRVRGAAGSLEAAQRHLTLAESNSESVPAGENTGGFCLGWSRLLLDRRPGNLPAVAEQAASRLQAPADDANADVAHLA